MEYTEVCLKNPEGIHMYINNICACGKVIDIIEEDEEENDAESKFCLRSKTGNHHYEKDICKYCGCCETERVLLSKQILRSIKMKRMSLAEIRHLVHIGNEEILKSRGRRGSYTGGVIKIKLIHMNTADKKDIENIILNYTENIGQISKI